MRRRSRRLRLWGSAAFASIAQSAGAANLLGLWTFNDTAEDATGNGNNVVFVGDPSFVSLGPTNRGISLSPAAGQYVDFGSSPLFNLTGAFSLESWVTVRNLPAPGSEPLIFGKDHTLFGITYYSNGNSYSYVAGGANTVAVPLSLNHAYHLVQTWDGSTIRVYRDGILAGTLSCSVAPLSNGATSLYSGRPGPSDGTALLDAIVDETRIYSGTLTAAEVTASYQAGPTQLVPRWIAQSGDWHNASNWIGVVPNAAGSIANFGDTFTAPSTIVIDQPTVIGTLKLDSTQRIVLAGASSLSLQGDAGAATILVNQGSHKINLPSVFISNCGISIANDATLTLGNPVTIKSGKTVASTGSLRIEAPLIIEGGGTLALGAGTVLLRSLPLIGPQGRIDIDTAVLQIEYGNTPSPADMVEAMVRAGDIVSSNAGEDSTLGWRDFTGASLIQVCRSLRGDADLDGRVDSVDFNRLLAGFGTRNTATWAEGDFNYDDRVNTLDFNHLAGNFGRTLSGPTAGAVVPEPASLLVPVIVTGLSRRRPRH